MVIQNFSMYFQFTEFLEAIWLMGLITTITIYMWLGPENLQMQLDNSDQPEAPLWFFLTVSMISLLTFWVCALIYWCYGDRK